jgi:hypothetical protein
MQARSELERRIRLASLRRQLPEPTDVNALLAELRSQVPERFRGLRQGTIWHRCQGDGGYDAACFVETCVSQVPGVEVHVLAPVVAACGFTIDDETAAANAFDDVKKWLALHGHESTASKREYYWQGAIELQFAVG